MFGNLQQFLEDHMALRPFSQQLRCYSAAFLRNKPEADRGGKIILPQSALDHLSRLNIAYPMLFRLTSAQVSRQRVTHCGVLEFIAEEGKCYLPHWMMKNLLLEEGEIATVENVSLQVGNFVKFKPQSVDFLTISNPRAVLEVSLRTYACLTKGDIIAIYYNDKEYELEVLEVKPENAVSIHECDLNVDFDAPKGYVEPQRIPKTETVKPEAEAPATEVTVPLFPGQGQRVDGKTAAPSSKGPLITVSVGKGGVVPDYDWKVGTLNFVHIAPLTKKSNENQKENDGDGSGGGGFQAFSGSGQRLRKNK